MLGYKTSERPIWYIEGETTTKKLMDRVDEDPPPVQVRLAGGRSPNSGRVEVRYHGAWGTVCNGGWDANDAEVVCRMLGYTGVQKFITTEFSPVKGITWFSYLRCTGTEMSITNCSHRGWGNPGCLHSSDIGVACKMATAPQFTVSSSSDKRSCTAMLCIIDHAKRNTKEKKLITFAYPTSLTSSTECQDLTSYESHGSTMTCVRIVAFTPLFANPCHMIH
ncbi:hypothetical protein QZH41_007845 [Actinostola sp. cb2023]|nr:hypothetical protein QZH41_007845 [Actinostola sp. cb2023]